MSLRAFRGSFLVAIDTEEGDSEDATPATLEQLTSYLKEAVIIDVNTEDYGNPVGFSSMEVLYSTLVELPESEVKTLYGDNRDS